MRSRRLAALVAVAAVIAGGFGLVGAGAATAANTANTAAAAANTDRVPGQLLVRYRAGTSRSQAAAAEAAAGATLRSEIAAIGVRVVSAGANRADAALAALQRNPNVEFAEADYLAHADAIAPNDSYWNQQWGTVKTMTNTAWSTTTGSSSVVVAVLDTGADLTHPDLQGAFTAGYDFVSRDSNPTDDNGHGTNVSGVIAARGNNNMGIAGQCWTCTIMPVKVLDANGSGSYSSIASGITYAADRGARIINLSLGGSMASDSLKSAVDYAWNKGALIVVAAGNAGNTAMTYPAAYDPALSVAASDSKDARYSWSTYGTWVEVAGPGCDYATVRGGGYSSVCGTSFASPMVAGIAGLLASANPSATNSAMRSALMDTTDPASYVAKGRVNAANAVARIGTTTAPSPSPSPSPAPATNTFSSTLSKQQPSRTFTVSAGTGSYSASLSFTRASSLTLTVKSTGGTVIGQATGPSVLKLVGSLQQGAYQFVVSGADRASFTLTVSHA